MNAFMELFDQEFAPKLGVREVTFRAIFREAFTIGFSSIVETGCIRQEDNWAGDGQSSLMFAAINKLNPHIFFQTVDIDEKATEFARSKVAGNGTVYCMDSVKFLRQQTQPIDLLYLDSYDVDMQLPHNAALHCMFEFTAALPRLHPQSIVAIDDSPMHSELGIGGKGKYVAQFMEKLGIRPFTYGYQVAWVMP